VKVRSTPRLISLSRATLWIVSAVVMCGAIPGAAAHSFGTVYNLPVPFSLYAYGATAALVVSFAIVAYFAGVPPAGAAVRGASGRLVRTLVRIGPGWLRLLRVMTVFALMLAIVAGFVGTRNQFANINMTLFWIIFTLGCFYLTAIVGDVYGLANPWRALCDVIERALPRLFRRRVAYPSTLAYYPALALYMAYIWIELFGHTQPRSLAVILLVYTAINVAGAALAGKDAWFRYGEFFAVMFRLAGKIAPLASQGVNIVRLISDPFGLGWDLLGTAKAMSTPIILDAGGLPRDLDATRSPARR